MEEIQAPVQEKKAFFSKKNLPLLIALAAAVVLIAALAVVLIVSSGPKAVAERFVKAGFNCDIEQIDKLSAYDFKAWLMGDEDGDEEEFFEEMGDELDEYVSSWTELSKAFGNIRQEELEDKYGNYEVEIKTEKVKDLSAKKLESLIGEKQYEKLEDFGFDSDKVKAGAEVTVKVKIKGDDGKDSYTETVYLAKIGGRWKVLSGGDKFFSGSPKSAAEKYITYVMSYDIPGYSSMLTIDYEGYLVDLYGYTDKKDFYERMTRIYDKDISSWEDYCKVYAEDNLEWQEEEYGKCTLSVEAGDVRELSAKELKSELGNSFLERHGRFGLDADKITGGAVVTVNARVDGEFDDEEIVFTVYMAKMDGAWKIMKVSREDK